MQSEPLCGVGAAGKLPPLSREAGIGMKYGPYRDQVGLARAKQGGTAG